MEGNWFVQAWRAFWNPPPPKRVQRAVDANTVATERLVKKISNSVTIRRDLSQHRGDKGHGVSD